MKLAKIDTIEDYSTVLETILTNGNTINVREEEYRELIGQAFSTPVKFEEFFENFEHFGSYLAKARVDYILATKVLPCMNKLGAFFEEDPCTRQAIIYMPDWYWEDVPEHVNCILAYQLMLRNKVFDLHVFMRSSDFFNAFPYDWYTASRHLEELKDLLEDCSKSAPAVAGRIYWYISNLHIREEDVDIIKNWIKQRR